MKAVSLPSPADVALEREIRLAQEELARTQSRAAWSRLQELVKRRSPAQVERMERAKGLA